jgi:hypothetical protein
MFHTSPSSSGYQKLFDAKRENDPIDYTSPNRSPSSGYGSNFLSPVASSSSFGFTFNVTSPPNYDDYSGTFNVDSLADALFEQLESSSSSCKPKPYSPLKDFNFAVDTSSWSKSQNCITLYIQLSIVFFHIRRLDETFRS